MRRVRTAWASVHNNFDIAYHFAMNGIYIVKVSASSDMQTFGSPNGEFAAAQSSRLSGNGLEVRCNSPAWPQGFSAFSEKGNSLVYLTDAICRLQYVALLFCITREMIELQG